MDIDSLPRDGSVSAGDFVFLAKDSSRLLFLKRKEGVKEPRSVSDGIAMFVKSRSIALNQGERTIQYYLMVAFGERFGLDLRKIALRNKGDQLWQFYKGRSR